MKSITKKLVKVMGSMSRIAKDGRNDFHKYNYVTEAAVLEEVRQALVENGLFITQSVDGVTKDGDLVTVSVTNTLIDAETGESLSVKSAGSGTDKGDKAIYKAITGATKYFLMKNFLLPTGDDPEASDENGKSTFNKATAKPTATAVAAKTETTVAASATDTTSEPKKKVSFSKRSFTNSTTTATSSGDL